VKNFSIKAIFLCLLFATRAILPASNPVPQTPVVAPAVTVPAPTVVFVKTDSGDKKSGAWGFVKCVIFSKVGFILGVGTGAGVGCWYLWRRLSAAEREARGARVAAQGARAEIQAHRAEFGLHQKGVEAGFRSAHTEREALASGISAVETGLKGELEVTHASIASVGETALAAQEALAEDIRAAEARLRVAQEALATVAGETKEGMLRAQQEVRGARADLRAQEALLRALQTGHDSHVASTIECMSGLRRGHGTLAEGQTVMSGQLGEVLALLRGMPERTAAVTVERVEATTGARVTQGFGLMGTLMAGAFPDFMRRFGLGRRVSRFSDTTAASLMAVAPVGVVQVARADGRDGVPRFVLYAEMSVLPEDLQRMWDAEHGARAAGARRALEDGTVEESRGPKIEEVDE